MSSILPKGIVELNNFDILSPQRKRRRWTLQQKLSIMAEIGRNGMSASAVGRKYGIPVRLLFAWKRSMHLKQSENCAWHGVTTIQTAEVEQLKQKMEMLEQLLEGEIAENRILKQMVERMLNMYVFHSNQVDVAR